MPVYLENHINICAIFGSPRPHGYSARVHEKVLGSYSDSLIERYHAYEMMVHPCTGCGQCDNDAKCAFDDMHSLYLSLLKADLVTISFPLYFSSLPGPLKNIIDRCQLLWCAEPDASKTKKGIVCITAGSDYKEILMPSHRVISHFMKSIGGHFESTNSIFFPSLDSENGRNICEEWIRQGVYRPA